MASYNRIVLVGNLTRDPERTALPNETSLCKFGIATNRKWTDATGAKREETCFVDCVVFGKQADVFAYHMKKGSQVLIEGRLTQNIWTKDGQKRSKHEVFVEGFTFVGSKQERNEQDEEPGF